MRYHKILVPYDGSEFSIRALHTAMDIVSDDDEGRVCVLTVVPSPAIEFEHAREEPPGPYDSGTMNFENYHKVTNVATAHARKSLADDIRIELDVLGDKGTTDAVASSSIDRGILGYAKMNDFELIVMGIRGFKSASGSLGSVCTKVLCSPSIPVLVVK